MSRKAVPPLVGRRFRRTQRYWQVQGCLCSSPPSDTTSFLISASYRLTRPNPRVTTLVRSSTPWKTEPRGGTTVLKELDEIEVITLFVEDVPACKSFYTDVFGLEVVYEDAGSAVVKLRSLIINLLTVDNAPTLVKPTAVGAAGNGVRALYTIKVADVDATLAGWSSTASHRSTVRSTGRGAAGPPPSPIRQATPGRSPSSSTDSAGAVQFSRPLLPFPAVVCKIEQDRKFVGLTRI